MSMLEFPSGELQDRLYGLFSEVNSPRKAAQEANDSYAAMPDIG